MVCLNLDYFVQSFCDDVRSDNTALSLNCSAKSLNGVDCFNGTCPCGAFGVARRRLLQATANLSTLIIYDIVDYQQPVEALRPTIRPT